MSTTPISGAGREGLARSRAVRWMAGIALLAAGVYVNTATHGFVFDDRLMIEQNRAVQGEGDLGDLLLAPYHSGFGAAATGLYRPLIVASFALDHGLGGLNPLGYHLVNILLHAMVSVLVLRVGWRVGLSPPSAAIGAALFAVHPLHTEVVANVAGRPELVSALGVLAALLAYIGATERHAGKRARLSWLAGLGLLVGLLSKESAVTFVGTALVWEVVAAGGLVRVDPRAVARRQLPLFVALAAYLCLRWVALGEEFAGPAEVSPIDNPLVGVGALERWATAGVVAVRYLVLWLFPYRLSPDYSYAQILPAESMASAPTLGAGLVLVALAALGVAALRRAPGVGFLGLFAVISFSIASNVVLVIGTVMAERLFYLPSVGLCLVAGAGLGRLAARRGARVATVLLVVLFGVAGARTIVRNREWRDDFTLFSAARETSPRSVKVRNNLATELMRRGDPGAALVELETALELAPDYRAAQANRIQCLLDLQRFAEAEVATREGAADPTDRGMRFLSGQALLGQGRFDEAYAVFAGLVDEQPERAELHERLAVVAMSRGDGAVAERAFRRALELEPSAVSALNGLGLLYRSSGRPADAVELFRRAVQADPGSPQLRNNLANALRDAGRVDESQRELEIAIRQQPGFAASHYNLGLTLERRGRLDEAAGVYRHVLGLRPGYPGAERALGRVRLAAGAREEALPHLDRAIAAAPDDVEAHALRARVHLAGRRFDAAEADYRRVLELNPLSVAARNNLGFIHAQRGETAKARAQWQEALRLAPDSQEIIDNLRRLDPPR